MRAWTLAAGLLLTLMLVAPGAVAQSGPSKGVYVGTVDDGERDHHYYTTHGGNPCLSIYIPKLYTVTLTGAATDTMTLSAGGHSATTTAGSARLSFVANYCTAFRITVDGVEIHADSPGAYAVSVTSVFAGSDAIAIS